jgi:MtN3 and saliva related transmembrane protein
MDEWLGFAAAAVTTLGYLPQVLKAWRTRSVQDVSLGMYLVVTVGSALWVWYGFRTGAAPVAAANALILVQALLVLAAKIRYA